MEEWIKNLPDGIGWWKECNEDLFNNTAKFLSDRGIEDDDIKVVLAGLYFAVIAECGN